MDIKCEEVRVSRGPRALALAAHKGGIGLPHLCKWIVELEKSQIESLSFYFSLSLKKKTIVN